MGLATLVVACSSSNEASPDRICTPEAYVFCRCKDRQEGTKQCNADGSGFAACLPCDGSGDPGPGSGGSDGLGGSHASEGSPSETDPPPPTSTATNAMGDAGPTGDEPPATNTDAGTTGGPTGEPTTTPPAPKRDAGTSPTPGPSGDSAPHCKPLTNIAPRIELQRIADSPKTATGGKPVDGVYVQAWVVEFTGEDGEAGPSKHYSQETLEITGATGRYVFADDEGKAAAGGFRLTAAGAKITVAYECPTSEPKELEYDATESTLIIYDPPYARVFTRQRGVR